MEAIMEMTNDLKEEGSSLRYFSEDSAKYISVL